MNVSPVNTNGETSAPPPPPEVKVRTMRSDLESMAKSGGGLPRFQSVRVAGLSGGRTSGDAARPAAKNTLMIALITIVALVALAVVGYFAYTLFFRH